jgi:hypothetical protein
LNKEELCGLLHTHRHELLMDDPQEGNVVHGKRGKKRRKGRSPRRIHRKTYSRFN